MILYIYILRNAKGIILAIVSMLYMGDPGDDPDTQPYTLNAVELLLTA